MNIIDKLKFFLNPLLLVLLPEIPVDLFKTYLLGLIQDDRYFSVLGLSRRSSKNRRMISKILKYKINWTTIMYCMVKMFEITGEWYLVGDASPIKEPTAGYRTAKHGRVSIKRMKNVPYNELVTLILTNGIVRIVLGQRIWVSPKVAKPCDYVTKPDLFLDLIMKYNLKKIPVKTIVFDNGFASKKILNWLNQHNYTWTTRLKRNTLLCVNDKYLRLDKYDFNLDESLIGTLKGIDGKVKIIKVKYKQKEIFVATNDINKSNAQITADYKGRWLVEEVFRDAKQSLGLEKVQMKSYKALVNHTGFVCLAFSLLSALKESKRHKIGDIKRAIQDELYSTHDAIDRFILKVA